MAASQGEMTPSLEFVLPGFRQMSLPDSGTLSILDSGFVIPAKAGIQCPGVVSPFAGFTQLSPFSVLTKHYTE